MDSKQNFTMFASAARTATENSGAMDTQGYRGIKLFLNISAASGTNETLDVKLQEFDELAQAWIDMPGCSFAQKTGTGHDSLVVYPGIAETANRSVSDVLAKQIRAVATIGGTDTPTFTYSLGGVFLT